MCGRIHITEPRFLDKKGFTRIHVDYQCDQRRGKVGYQGDYAKPTKCAGFAYYIYCIYSTVNSLRFYTNE